MIEPEDWADGAPGLALLQCKRCETRHVGAACPSCFPVCRASEFDEADELPPPGPLPAPGSLLDQVLNHVIGRFKPSSHATVTAAIPRCSHRQATDALVELHGRRHLIRIAPGQYRAAEHLRSS